MKFQIKNKNNKFIRGEVFYPPGNLVGSVIIQHGLAGCMEQAYIKLVRDVCVQKGCACLCFDTTNNFGISDGDLSESNLSNHISDLGCVFEWALLNMPMPNGLIMIGHSLGAASVGIFSASLQDFIERVVLLSPVTNFRNWEYAFLKHRKRAWEEWIKRGYLDKQDHETGKTGIIPVGFLEDLKCYNLELSIADYKRPVHIISGMQDITCPPECVSGLFDKLPISLSDKCSLSFVSCAPHTFIDEEHLNEMGSLLTKALLGSH